MTRYRNPAMFLMQCDAPFNFDFGWEEFDALYHDTRDTFDLLRPKSDPCQWPDDLKAKVNAERDEWVRKYDEWCGDGKTDA